MKKDKNGFKVLKSGQVYVASQTQLRTAPRSEVVSLVRDLWNNHPLSQKLRGHINHLTIKKIYTNSRIIDSGGYNIVKRHVKINDHDNASVFGYKQSYVHEVFGHAYYGWAMKWRREAWLEFNQFANQLRPINNYVRKYELKWKNTFLTHERFMLRASLYMDEQHSAAAEIFEDALDERDSLHTVLINESEKEELKKYYDKLHN